MPAQLSLLHYDRTTEWLCHFMRATHPHHLMEVVRNIGQQFSSVHLKSKELTRNGWMRSDRMAMPLLEVRRNSWIGNLRDGML